MSATESFSDLQLLDLIDLHAAVLTLRRDLVLATARQAAEIAAVQPRHTFSAGNLVQYAALRAHDVRDLQARLARYGLTSLGRTESHVVASIDGLLRTLARLTDSTADAADAAVTDAVSAAAGAIDLPDGAALLTRNTALLLGAEPNQRSTRIMVTLPSETAADPGLVRDMLAAGMDLARINCAHDGVVSWKAMIANIRSAEAATGARCRIAMDLGGPKLRTGPIEPGPEVLKVKPTRSTTGAVREPGLVWLGERPAADGIGAGDPGGAVSAAAAIVPLLDTGWAARRRVGDTVTLIDARGSHRTLSVVRSVDNGCLVALARTVYFVPGLSLRVDDDQARVGALPTTAQALLVHRGDTLVLTADLTPTPASTGAQHRIGCTLPAAFQDAQVGERVMLDDGKIGGVITAVTPGEVAVEITSAATGGTKLRAEKGINLPDTRLNIPALTDQDVADLDFVRRHADIVNVSFVRSAADVRDLLGRLAGNPELGIVLKIETVAAFEALPQILLEALRWQNVGVMIARGDLAVEAGFERLAEVQEEILWLCEAAHVPVIWATQVLDTLARTGLPSRAEVTDAAMAERAECVMLNKGPFIVDAISMLAGILVRMQGHTDKKRSLLRRLRAWDRSSPTR